MPKKTHDRKPVRKALFSALSNQARIDILLCLGDGEKNVSQIAKELVLGQPLISHNLNKLLESDFLRVRRVGNFRYYGLNEAFARPFLAVIDSNLTKNSGDFLAHIDRDGIFLEINHMVKGLLLDKVIGTSLKDCLSEAYHPKLQKALIALFKNGTPQKILAQGIAQNPESWYECCMKPIRVDGKIIAASIVASSAKPPSR